jgi:hypothetical protein
MYITKVKSLCKHCLGLQPGKYPFVSTMLITILLFFSTHLSTKKAWVLILGWWVDEWGVPIQLKKTNL